MTFRVLVTVGVVLALALSIVALNQEQDGTGAVVGPEVFQKMFFNDDITVDSTDFAVDVSADEVGVGTSSPAYQFHVANGGATTTSAFAADDGSAHTCFEVRNSAGTDQRMYVNGTTLVIEAGDC